MSKPDEFRQYAEEAMLRMAEAKTKEEKLVLLELLCTWAEAAVVSEFVPVVSSPPEVKVP